MTTQLAAPRPSQLAPEKDHTDRSILIGIGCTLLFHLILALLSATQASAAPPIFEMRAKYSEFLVGEDVRVQMSVSNPTGSDIFSFVKLGVGMYPGSFETV